MSPNVPTHFDLEHDRRHWERMPSPSKGFTKDGMAKGGRTSKTEWWSAATGGDRQFEYGQPVDLMYDQEHYTLKTAVDGSPRKYANMHPDTIKRYPGEMLDIVL